MSGTILRAVSTGTAKPMPTEPPEGLKIMVLIPTMRPRESRSGPPELPGLIAASVWITPSISRSVNSERSGRASPETIPVVSVRSRPKGLPMANTFCRRIAPSSCRADGVRVSRGDVNLDHGEVVVRSTPNGLGVVGVCYWRSATTSLRAPWTTGNWSGCDLFVEDRAPSRTRPESRRRRTSRGPRWSS